MNTKTGIIKTTAEGPYTVTARFPKAAQVNSLSMSFSRCQGDGIGTPDQVTYYYQPVGSAVWIELGTVTKEDALVRKNIAAGWDGYNYEFKAEKPIEAAVFKAVFQREMTPHEMWWIAPDEFLINGSLTETSVQNVAEEALFEEKPMEELFPAEKLESVQDNEEQALPEEMPLEKLISAQKVESEKEIAIEILPLEEAL